MRFLKESRPTTVRTLMLKLLRKTKLKANRKSAGGQWGHQAKQARDNVNPQTRQEGGLHRARLHLQTLTP